MTAPDHRAGAGRRETGPVWLHATTPDVVDMLRVLAAALADLPGAPGVLLTGTATQTGGTPGEDPRALAAFLARESPVALVLAGGLLPPALIAAMRGRGGVFLVDALQPQPPGYRRLVPGYTRALLSGCTEIHARTPAAAQALARLTRGAVAVHCCGTLARYPAAPPCNEAELGALRDAVGSRPCWFAYSLPAGEEDAALLAHAHALRSAHRLLMIAAPRDPARGPEIAARAQDVGFSIARRALDQDILETTQVYIADAEDEPGLFLRLAPVSYLGGSLTQDAGIPSPVLAAALGSAMIHGRFTDRGQRAFLDALHAVGGGRRIAAAPDLGGALAALIAPDAGALAALNAWTLATEGADNTAALARSLCDWIALNAQ